MNNNPKYRQEWILDNLKVNPTIGYLELFPNYSLNFSKTRRTFSKDWNSANVNFKYYQDAINKAKLEESIAQEKESVKRNILSKNDALEILTEIAQGKAKKIQGEIIMPSFNERTSAIKTIAEFQGWKAPTKIDIDGTVTISNSDDRDRRISELKEKLLKS